jgi:hypothetical protein
MGIIRFFASRWQPFVELHKDLTFHYQRLGQVEAVSERMQKVNDLEKGATPEPFFRNGRDPVWPVEF